MKKQITCLSAALLFFIFSYSQTSSNNGYVSISAGPSFPTGDFGNDDITSIDAGLAKWSQSLNISYSRLLGKHLGIAVSLLGQRNALDTRSMEKQFSKTEIVQGFWFASDVGEPPPTVQGTVYPNWEFDKGSWLSGSLLVGGYGEFPFSNEKIAFTAKALAGLTFASAPAINGSSITDTATVHIKQTKSSGWGLAYSVNGGLKFNLNKKLYLLTQLEYFTTADLRFKDVKATITATHGTPDSPGFSVQQSMIAGEARQIISSINVLIGVALKI